MAVANVSQGVIDRLPEDLKTAQEAISLPEVQEMLQRLSAYNLGIYMPHMHDEQSGAFAPLPAGLTQVEDGLQVTFQPVADTVDEPGGRTFLPVGWFWREEGGISASVCTSNCVMQGTMHTSGHNTSSDSRR